MFRPSVSRISIIKYLPTQITHQQDLLALEEPLEIRLVFGSYENRQERSLTITMRTPGHDFELAVGFLFNEGVIHSYADIISLKYCETTQSPEAKGNIVKVGLTPTLKLDWTLLTRNFYTTSSCGICGKSSIESVHTKACNSIFLDFPPIPAEVITGLPQKLQAMQTIFAHTGGIHAAGLFDFLGELLLCREDIGRHNAVDKVLGAAIIQRISMEQSILFLSGRVGFELVQKARMAAIPIIVAVGAPSSLAVSLAQENNMTLIGFLRNESFNIYSGEENIKLPK